MKTESILRIGIIGCGSIAFHKHMPALKAQKNIEMTAFCDIVEEHAQKAADEFGISGAGVYADYRELLKDESIDIVHVCTPNREHSVTTIDALEAGKHVMCEKPMAKTYAEAKAMLDAAKRTGKKLTIGYQNRQLASSQYCKNLCEKGVLGDVYFADALALRRRGVPTWGVFLDEEEQGGGPLIDIGTHALDLTLWCMNNYKPKMVVGSAYHKLSRKTGQGNPWGSWDPDTFKVEDSAFGFIVMENGATVVLQSAWAINRLDTYEASFRLCGDAAGLDALGGNVRVNGVRDNEQYIDVPQVTAERTVGGVTSDDASTLDMAQWLEAIRTDTDPCVLPEQAMCVTRILEAVYESAKTGKPIYFDN